MQVTLSVIGKLRDPALKSLFDEYKKRLDWKITLHEFEAKASSLKEGELLLKSLPPATFMIILDEKGENLKSEEFAELLKNIQIHHQGKVGFVVGGPDGLDDEVKTKAQKSLSFGRMTWPHLLVRVMLMEQLYRAQQILKNHPYHRE
ncbi:MAG TPA: 23S rRNA (pseudouridine(1915)-N(3))-methyltransferase RlmH [Alphaproteobacteria bacterium]|nr:23S rRNA (pseudouridine(1915)-N(3))-methyltransferase RlmH [Alphaproteobacteria bacterium]